MTNAGIILAHSMELVKEGKLALIDNFPEPIHTFQIWKKLGYSVKKGEKAIAKFPIWKYTTKSVEDEDTGEITEDSSMFMKTAAFFKFSQVEKLDN